MISSTLRTLLFIVAVLMSSSIAAQSAIDDIIDEIAADMEADGQLDDDAAIQIAELRDASQTPILINSAGEEHLSQLFFLTSGQIRSLLYHRRMSGGFRTAEELLTVRGLSAADVGRMLPFITFEGVDTTIQQHRFLKCDIIGRLQSSLPRAKGFIATDSTEASFFGPPVKSLLRLTAAYGRHLRLGLTAETDAGEPRWSHSVCGPDFHCGYLCYEGYSIVSRAVVGTYHLRLGQGLGLWTGFGFNPTTVGVSTDRNGGGLSPTISASEGGSLQGAAMQMRLSPLRLTAFASYVRHDATLHKDVDSSIYIMGLRTDGLHRTATERSHRHNNPAALAGLYLQYDIGIHRIGIGANIWHSSHRLGHGSRLYRVNMPEGHKLTTLHTDYHCYLGRAVVYGEAALQGHEAWGLSQGVSVAVESGSFCFALRKFARSYHALLQQPISRNRSAGGEGGAYLGAELSPLTRLQLRAGVDIYRHHFLRSNTQSPTAGWRIRASAAYFFSDSVDISVRLRHSSEEDPASPVSFEKKQTSTKAILHTMPQPWLNLHTVAEYTVADTEERFSTGMLLCQCARVAPSSGIISLSLSGSYFHTGSYDARVYTRLPNVLYDMGFGTCSGRGFLCAAMIKADPAAWLSLWVNAQYMHRTDVRQIGSGNDATEGPDRLTVKLQTRMKLWSRYYGNTAAKKAP